ncbi:hypothetical protein ACHAW5_000246 [Stephanodiscus triporus]|uniref:Tr-type G domain-containing protein n=1 Tax=Stephanodiscus triporus TaxID=2934178 RepID=A0ABD3NB44_9STRA
MAHRTVERRLTYCCLSALCLQITSAFVAPAPYFEVPSRTSRFATTHEAASVADENNNPTFAQADDFADYVNEYVAPLNEIERRRNLAIISHPDSGKTTMTEKLLLYGGALQQAGAVRMKGEQRATQSDFMEMEKARGISIR